MPRVNEYQHIIPHSLGSIVRGFKTGVSKWFREKWPHVIVWQRNFHDHIIRDEKSLYFIRRYIRNNHMCWYHDGKNHLGDEIDHLLSDRP